MPIPSTLTTARNAFTAQRAALIDALFEADQAAQKFRDAERILDPTSPILADLELTKVQKEAAAVNARAAVRSATQALLAEITTWLQAPASVVDPLAKAQADIGRLSAQLPAVLFPLRIETRFEGVKLKLRVYPDDIFLNRHETALTVEEQAAGQHYYEELNKPGGVSEQANWRDMVRRFGSLRSAYILRAMLPAVTSDAPLPRGIPVGQNLTLIFPDVQSRSGSWTRPAEALLPDRWVVMLRRGNARRYVLGNPIPEPLAVTVDPGASPADQSTLPNGHVVDDKARWIIDFDRAVDVGMALSIDLTPDDVRLGFDRVVVFGLKTSLSESDTAFAIEKLIDAHHYTRGVAFLRQGTVTNNAQDKPTVFPPADDAGTQSFAIERNTPLEDVGVPTDRFKSFAVLPPTNTDAAAVDGYYWTKFVGVPSGAVQNVDGAFEEGHQRAVAMSRVLWPATFGTFLKFMMDPIFTEDGIEKAKQYASGSVANNATGNVFARGPAPVIRIGAVPYGLFPVASLKRWKPRALGRAEDQLVEEKLLLPLQQMLGLWKEASKGVNRLKPKAAKPVDDLILALSLFPNCRQARLRFGYGQYLLYDAFSLFGWDIGEAVAAFNGKTTDLFQLMVGHGEWRPRIGNTTFLAPALLATAAFVDLDKNLSETSPLTPNYIDGINNATVADLVNNTVASKPNPSSLLYELLRIATLTEYALKADIGLRSAVNPPQGVVPWFNDEVWDIPPLLIEAQSIIRRLLDTGSITIKSPSGATTTYDSLEAYAKQASFEHGVALVDLQDSPTAELDRLVRETLDLASHRLDAWVTAFATRRVLAMRTLQEGGIGGPDPAFASFLGGYGWIEDLRPATHTTVTGPDGTQVDFDATSGGFIHAPSSRHAMAAAAMRSGYLSFSGEVAKKFAFDLSSRQVRSAMQILDEVRSGQHVGEVLGYRIERGLQERKVPALNALRFTLRNLFPLVAGKNGVDTTQPADRVAAGNVVDGLALYRAYQAKELRFDDNPLPAPGKPGHDELVAELDNLVQLMDAVADLLVGEGVFQLAGGNVEGALPSLHNLVRGGRPPNPGIAQSPRAGRGLTHRLIYIFQGDPGTLPSSWKAPTPRAAAEPTLNAWLGSIIGDPTKVVARVTFRRGDDTTGSQTVTLADLGIHPLDILALAHAVLQPNQAGLLDARVIEAAIAALHAAGDDSPKKDFRIDYGRAPSQVPPPVTFSDVMELANTLGAALGASRPLALEDLVSPADVNAALVAAESTSLKDAADEMQGRADQASATLSGLNDAVATALANLDPNTQATIDALQQSLRDATRIAIERGFPPAGTAADELADRAAALLKEFARRLAAIATVQPDASKPSRDRIADATAILKAVFGPDTFVMPRVMAPAADLKQSLDTQATLTGGDDRAVARIVEQAAHARTQLSKCRKFALYAHALGTPVPRADVVQLPFVPGEKWLALPFAVEPEESRVSLVLFSQEAKLDLSKTWHGIVLESWTEVIPSRTQPTSIAFNYNGPHAEAPHCVLVVAPSGSADMWDVNDIVATLEETLDLAKVRAVDRDPLGSLGQAIPAIVIPTSLNPKITTSTGVIGSPARPDPSFSRGFER